MARSKYAAVRYRIINRELRKKAWIKTSELKRKIESELGKTISERQIEIDLRDMQSDISLNFNAPIAYDKSNKAYQYTDRSFSIEKFALGEDEITALKFYAASLNQYRDYGIFKDFSSVLQKVVDAVSINSQIGVASNSRLIVQTDNNVLCKGGEFLGTIAKAIDERSTIEFQYKKFEETTYNQRVFSPFLLKEYKNRWYIIGKLNGKTNVTTFALDRINKLKLSAEPFNSDVSFDHKKYFKYSFGITKPDEPPVKVTLLFTHKQGNYVKSLPIHVSQKIVSETKKGVRLIIEVIPSYELYEYLRGQGDNVKIISPKWLATEIKSSHQQAVMSYGK
jgi:predicted DNA-binding transcriptional regulator YafY